MHINDINVFAYRKNLDDQFAGRGARVIVILPKNGEKFYIGMRGNTKIRDEAAIFDYDRDRVGEQVAQVFEMYGEKPEVVEV